MKKILKYGIGVLCAVIAAVAAILVHAFLPSPGATTDPTLFDGYLVQVFGFPFVASMYFVILYLHIFIIMCIFGSKAPYKKVQIGVRYGTAFGLMYLIGMQEVMVEASPLTTYGVDFVGYQFFMGLGDAIPAFLLCLIIGTFIIRQKQYKEQAATNINKYYGAAVIIVVFFVERVVRYYMGYIDSDIHQYPIPVLVWTLVMAIVFAVMNLLLSPIYTNSDAVKKSIQINLLTVGLNWIWFNCFIGLILKETFIKMFLRSAVDILAITFGCVILNLFLKRTQIKTASSCK